MTLQEQIRETRREMREKGIRRMSCFNGGHSPESYRLNARMFELETKLKSQKTSAQALESANDNDCCLARRVIRVCLSLPTPEPIEIDVELPPESGEASVTVK